MRGSFLFKSLVLLLGAYLMSGCETEQVQSALRADPAPLSKFLPNRRLLVRQPDTFPFHYFYLNKDVRRYKNVYVAPVNTQYLRESSGWAKFDHMMNGQLGGSVDDLANFMRQAYIQAFRLSESSPRLKVVGRRDLPGTLVVETALVAIVPSKAELNALGLAGSFVLPGIGIVTSLMSAGSVTVECRIKDGRTGKVLAMYANTESDPKALISVASYTWMSSSRINIKLMAAQTVRVLAARDCRTVKRDSPVRFATLLEEGELTTKKKAKK